MNKDKPPLSCCGRLDYFLWPNDEPTTREYKQSQHVRAYSSPTNNRCLYHFRIFTCVFMLFEYAYTIIDNSIEYTYVQMQYFTLWGVAMTAFTCTILLIGMCKFKPDVNLADDQSPFCLWKWCSYCFQMNFFWNILISLLFWGFILPTGSYNDFTNGNVNLQIKFALDHTCPCLFLTIDWFLDGIQFEWSHLIPNSCILLLYGSVNWTFCSISGKEIYPILTWDSLNAWLLAGAVFIFALLIQIMTVACTKYKIRKLLAKHSNENDPNMYLETTDSFAVTADKEDQKFYYEALN